MITVNICYSKQFAKYKILMGIQKRLLLLIFVNVHQSYLGATC